MLDILHRLARGWDQAFTYEIRLPAATPGAGSEFTYQPNGSEIWIVNSVRASLAASAAAGTRETSLIVSDGSHSPARYAATAAQAAGTTVDYTWALGGPVGQAATGAPTIASLGDYLVLPGQWTLKSSTVALDAGDQWSNVALAAFILRIPPTGVAKSLTDHAEVMRQAAEAIQAAAELIEHDER